MLYQIVAVADSAPGSHRTPLLSLPAGEGEFPENLEKEGVVWVHSEAIGQSPTSRTVPKVSITDPGYKLPVSAGRL